MQKYWGIILTGIIIMILSSCKDKNNLVIKGEISNLESPYILSSHLIADTLVIDTIKTNKGKFTYRLKVDTLTAFTLYFNNLKTSVLAFGDKKQKITLKGNASQPDLIEITGNEINDDLTKFKKENETLLKQRADLFNIIKADKENKINNDILTENDKLAQINSLNHDLMQKAEDYIEKHPSKIASVILINDFFKTTENPQSLERVLSYLKGKAAETRLKAKLTAYKDHMKLSAEGVKMPYFQLIDTKKDTIRSTDLSGKYIVLSFLSANGEDSRQNTKMLKETYKKLKKDSVRFISIYIDSDIYPIKTIANDSTPWISVSEKKSWASDIVSTYNIKYAPYNILIFPNGIIKDREISASEIEKTLKKHNIKQVTQNKKG